MKFKGFVKVSANNGTKFVKLLWKGDWDCKASHAEYNGRSVQITDCPSTFDSAMNECIYAKDKARKKKEVK